MEKNYNYWYIGVQYKNGDVEPLFLETEAEQYDSEPPIADALFQARKINDIKCIVVKSKLISKEQYKKGKKYLKKFGGPNKGGAD